MGESHRRWDPATPRSSRNYWPIESDSSRLADAIGAFEAVGFRQVAVARARVGWQTITLYAAGAEVTHAARLLGNGRWTSKLGPDIDIDTLDALRGGLYGEPAVMLERPAGRTDPPDDSH